MQGFLSFVISMRERKEYALSCIGNMDETSVWTDMPGDYTMEQTGTRTVSMGSTGHNCLPWCYGRWNKASSEGS